LDIRPLGGEIFGFKRRTKQKGRAEMTLGTGIQLYFTFQRVMELTYSTF
jgi:hypothetical protein